MEKCSDNGQLAEAIIAFDTLYTTNHMQMLKLLSPYLDMENQHRLAIYIKWQELQYTLNFMSNRTDSCHKVRKYGKKELDISTLIPTLSPYCSEREKALLSQFGQMQSMMHTYQDMLQYLPMIQEMMAAFTPPGDGSRPGMQFPGGENPQGSNSMMDMLKNMLTPEQQSMLSLFMEGGIP